MIDIVTVVFKSELEVLKLQARSIELYCDLLDIGKISVIVNDDDSVAGLIDPAWWGHRANLVDVIPRSRWNHCWSDNGWVSQQVLKLLACGDSSSDWCMILDAKTLLVNPIEADQLFDSQNRVSFGTLPVIGVFAPAAQIASDLLGIPVTHTAGPGGVPFFMEPEQVRSLFAFVQDRTQQSLPDWFQQKGMITEFVLYSAWIQHQTGDLATRYSQQKYWPCNLCHSEVARFEQKFSDMHKSNIVTVSIHRNAWSQLTADQQQRYRDFLTSRGIQ